MMGECVCVWVCGDGDKDGGNGALSLHLRVATCNQDRKEVGKPFVIGVVVRLFPMCLK